MNARGCGALGDDGAEAIARGCSRLRALDLGATDVSEAGLQVYDCLKLYSIIPVIMFHNIGVFTVRIYNEEEGFRAGCCYFILFEAKDLIDI